MERILGFDELVDIIMHGGEKSVFDSALSSFAGSCMFNENQLYYIAIEYGRYDLLPELDSRTDYMAGCEEMSFYAGLYSEESRANIKRSILNRLNVYFEVSTKFLALLYHLMKNHCYDIMIKEIEMAELFVLSREYFTEVMAAAVKNQDTEALKLFIDRGYTFETGTQKKLMSIYPDYMKETVLPMLERGEANNENNLS